MYREVKLFGYPMLKVHFCKTFCSQPCSALPPPCHCQCYLRFANECCDLRPPAAASVCAKDEKAIDVCGLTHDIPFCLQISNSDQGLLPPNNVRGLENGLRLKTMTNVL